MKTLPSASIASATGHAVDLALEGGGRFSIAVLEPSMVRVRWLPAGGYKEPRTWAIAPEPGKDVAWGGRVRDDPSGFSHPDAQLTRQPGQVTLRTDVLSVSVQEHPLRLVWHDRQGRPFAQDRATS